MCSWSRYRLLLCLTKVFPYYVLTMVFPFLQGGWPCLHEATQQLNSMSLVRLQHLRIIKMSLYIRCKETQLPWQKGKNAWSPKNVLAIHFCTWKKIILKIILRTKWGWACTYLHLQTAPSCCPCPPILVLVHLHCRRPRIGGRVQQTTWHVGAAHMNGDQAAVHGCSNACTCKVQEHEEVVESSSNASRCTYGSTHSNALQHTATHWTYS